jgi:hypothetical protein
VKERERDWKRQCVYVQMNGKECEGKSERAERRERRKQKEKKR